MLRNTAPEQPVGTWRLAAAVLRGYQRRRPLLPEEADVLGELVIARLLLTEAISATRAPVHVENTAYITQYDAANRRVLDAFTALDGAALRRRVRRLTGLAAPGLRSEADGDLRARRRAVQAGDLSPLFYAEPIDVVAAQDVWLIDRSGKMSKSSGEFLRLQLLVDKGFHPLAYRLMCLQAHYRSELEFSWEGLQAAFTRL